MWQHRYTVVGERYEISLTRLQQLIRDQSSMDLVCLFECCDIGNNACLEPLETTIQIIEDRNISGVRDGQLRFIGSSLPFSSTTNSLQQV